MKKILLAGNGSFQNHGCEAITLGTLEILKRTFGTNIQIIYAAHSNEEECNKDLSLLKRQDIIASAFITPFKKYSKEWTEYQLNRFVHTSFTGGFKQLEEKIDEADIVLALSGDNYSFDYGYPEIFIQFDRFVLKHRKPLVYWGLSIGPFSADKRFERVMKYHIPRINRILVRETESLSYLRSIGIQKNVYLVADPAFLMDPVQPDSSRFVLSQKDFIGINFSTTVGRLLMPNIRESDPTQGSLLEDTLNNKSKYDHLCIEYAEVAISLYELCHGNMVFIPHAMGGVHSDYEFMKRIADILETRGYTRPIVVPPDLTAPEYKWIISQARCFIGARTHSTIAAFSSGVPTISLSYSLKARGITHDMYGNDDFCISGKDVSPDSLQPLAKRLILQESVLRKHLKNQAQVMVERALFSGEIIKGLVG